MGARLEREEFEHREFMGKFSSGNFSRLLSTNGGTSDDAPQKRNIKLCLQLLCTQARQMPVVALFQVIFYYGQMRYCSTKEMWSRVRTAISQHKVGKVAHLPAERQKQYQQRAFEQMTKEQIAAMGYKLKYVCSAEQCRMRLEGRDGYERGSTFYAHDDIVVLPQTS